MKKILISLIILIGFISFCDARTVTITSDNGYYSYNGWVDNEGLTISFDKPPKSYILTDDGDSTNLDARLYFGYESTFDTDKNYLLSGDWISDNKNYSYTLYLEASDGDNDSFRFFGKE